MVQSSDPNTLSPGTLDHFEKNDKSSEFLNITNPPQPSETPDPSSLFPIKRRPSANYKSALLTSQFAKLDFPEFFKHPHHPEETKEVDPLSSLPSDNVKAESLQESSIDSSEPISYFNNRDGLTDNGDVSPWSAEDSKRSLQRGSVCIKDTDDNLKCFNVQYHGSVAYPPGTHIPSSETSSTDAANDEIPPQLAEPSPHHSHRFPSFNYADFKKRMSTK